MTDSQLDMFGGSPAGTKDPIGSAPLDDETSALIERMPTDLFLGCSSWSFPGWSGIVYDRKADKSELANAGLGAYAQQGLFRTVCIDRGFYAPIPIEDFTRYAAAVPDDFRFVVKADGACTRRTIQQGNDSRENPRFLDSTYATEEVVGPYIEGLGKKAGLLVFQFPPLGAIYVRKPQQFADQLQTFLAALPKGPRYAVEIRDGFLLGPWFSRAIRETGSHVCHSLHPRMPPLGKQRDLTAAASRGPLVVRWNLHPTQLYDGALNRYAPFDQLMDEDRPTRLSLARLARETLSSGREVFIIVNNKAEGSAPLSIAALARAIIDRQTV
jgi:uncharacterized protein YecE (DUF72 family)